MPKGIPAAGFRRTKKYKTKTLQELEQDLALKAPDIVAELEKLTKPFECPSCGVTIKIIDKDVGMYLVDRAMGKPKQKHEVDVTENIQLTAGQIDRLVVRYAIAERARQLLAGGAQIPQDTEVIEGEYSEAPPGNTGTDIE